MPPVRFGPFEFDRESGRLRRNGEVVELQAQPARVLDYLVRNSGRTVTRQELIRHVWKDGHHVQFNQGLNYCIRQIRIALDDDSAVPQFLATVPRAGYRWMAPVPCGSTRMRMLATAAACASVVMALVSVTPRTAPPFERSASSHLSLAIDALHTLSHAAIEPARRAEVPGALRTLWVVTASHVGLASDAELH